MGIPGREDDHGAATQRRLRAALRQALRRRDSTAVAALRSALSALGNAEAVTPAAPVTGASSPHLAAARSGLGAGEAPRRRLTAGQVEQVIQAEISERRHAALGYERAGQPGRAQRLRAEADALESAVAAGQGPAVPPGADDPNLDAIKRAAAADVEAMEREKRIYFRPDGPGDIEDDR
jgi:uncharacterized protein YqeY